ncbi:predicted protein [Lichtheimia corymbifera JMRC:FSU:9682]|uniref:Uncharacterized protein n=1 Tax=Lichtheimia corymbifera JMRC:FSU:9682 TaxID=1263082 RepID=A0A068RTD2_9FUNG|nr:predicted protein [Lichtheimia corymbifera JMRC:FSU:9682]
MHLAKVITNPFDGYHVTHPCYRWIISATISSRLYIFSVNNIYSIPWWVSLLANCFQAYHATCNNATRLLGAIKIYPSLKAFGVKYCSFPLEIHCCQENNMDGMEIRHYLKEVQEGFSSVISLTRQGCHCTVYCLEETMLPLPPPVATCALGGRSGTKTHLVETHPKPRTGYLQSNRRMSKARDCAHSRIPRTLSNHRHSRSL